MEKEASAMEEKEAELETFEGLNAHKEHHKTYAVQESYITAYNKLVSELNSLEKRMKRLEESEVEEPEVIPTRIRTAEDLPVEMRGQFRPAEDATVLVLYNITTDLETVLPGVWNARRMKRAMHTDVMEDGTKVPRQGKIRWVTLTFQWYQEDHAVGAPISIPLTPGSTYVLSDQAAGSSRVPGGYNLRHSVLYHVDLSPAQQFDQAWNSSRHRGAADAELGRRRGRSSRRKRNKSK